MSETPPPAETEKPTVGKPARGLPRWKKWLFRLLAVGLAALFFVCVEVGLRLGGVGRDLSLVVEVPGNPGELKYQLNEFIDEAYFRRSPLGGPETRRFDLPRPSNCLRIVVIGGSTVQGFPWPSELSFPRHLEVILSKQLPGRKVEVLNAGITSINSFSIADLVREAAAAEPQLIIVYTGHNEFYGPGGVASTASGFSSLSYSFRTRLQRLRITQLFANALVKKSDGDLMEVLPRELQIPFDSPLVETAKAHYRANLAAMTRHAHDAGIPLLLTTVASNLRHQSPIRAAFPDSLERSVVEKWTQFFHAGEHLSANREWEAALAQFEQARELYAEHAILAYRTAQCLEGLERWKPAAEKFAEARDLDLCRFRAPESFRKVVGEVAEQAGEWVHFLDVAEKLGEKSAPYAPGDELFLEHVHFTLDGHWEVARHLAQSVVRDVLKSEWKPKLVPTEEQRDALLGATIEDRLTALTVALEVLGRTPMDGAFDVRLHREAIINQMKELFEQLSPAEQEVFSSLTIIEMAENLLKTLAPAYRKAGLNERSLELAEALVVRRPWSPEAWDLLAAEHQAAGRKEEQAAAKERADRLREVVEAIE